VSGGSPAAAPAARQSKDTATAALLTPDGVRTAIKALQQETGRDGFGDFTAYGGFVPAESMVDGSDSKYDTCIYRPGRGVEKASSRAPCPAATGLVVRQPNDTFGTPSAWPST
jgi:hypothetical protein